MTTGAFFQEKLKGSKWLIIGNKFHFPQDRRDPCRVMRSAERAGPRMQIMDHNLQMGDPLMGKALPETGPLPVQDPARKCQEAQLHG